MQLDNYYGCESKRLTQHFGIDASEKDSEEPPGDGTLMAAELLAETEGTCAKANSARLAVRRATTLTYVDDAIMDQ